MRPRCLHRISAAPLSPDMVPDPGTLGCAGKGNPAAKRIPARQMVGWYSVEGRPLAGWLNMRPAAAAIRTELAYLQYSYTYILRPQLVHTFFQNRIFYPHFDLQYTGLSRNRHHGLQGKSALIRRKKSSLLERKLLTITLASHLFPFS